MNKYDLINELVKRNNIGFKEASIVVNTIFDSMMKAVLNNERIEIRGFGSFTTRSYKPYIGRNPKTREKIEVKPKRLPHFKPSREIKKLLNE